MKNRVRVSARPILLVCALLLLANVVLGALLLKRSETIVKSLINARMLDIANTAASMIDGDVLKKLTAEDEDTPEYQKIYDLLLQFQENIALEYIYTVRDMGNGAFIFLVDPAEDPSEFGELVAVTAALKRASLGTPSVDEEPYSDRWGRFYSAYSPVRDSAGRIIGLVCVDFSAEWYEAQLVQSSRTAILFSLISLLIGVSVAIAVTAKTRSRLHALNEDLGALTGDVDVLMAEISVDNSTETREPAPDEIGELSKRIGSMRDALRRYIDHTHAQANGMITAMASDYRSVYYIDLDTDEGICYRAHSKIDNGLREGEHFSFREVFADYANRYVAESYREEFLRFISPQEIRKELEKESIVAHRYLVVRNGHESYEMLRMAGVRHPEDRTDHMIHAVGVGFTDVDKETRESLAQRQALRDALVLAENANLAKTAFLSNMSHEIRTPMNAIIGLDTIALSDPEVSGKTREYLEKIGESAQHLLSLINDILDMSRIESGRTIVKNEVFSLPKLLEQINAMIDSQCRGSGLSYDCRVAGELGDWYVGDDTKLRQVLINILGNAVKFTPAGGEVALAVERTAHYGNKTTLRFTIRDTGVGMDPSFLPRLFDPFSQEDSSATNKYGSTGLGMAIARNIVEMMNGNIGVESEKGVGTTFTVTVTLLDSDHAEDASNAGEDPPPADDAPGGKKLAGRRILLAEDMDINAEIMMDILGMRGIQTERAENGRIAVEMFSSRPEGWYDAILMDIRMPEMNGLEAASAIRALARADAKAIPILALTANAFDEDVQRSLQAGLNAHLSKPVEPGVLFDTLERLL